MLKVSDISEFDLINRLEHVLKKGATGIPGSYIETAIGDDAAVILPINSTQVVTTDTMVEDVHFKCDTTTMVELGWKAIAVNYSDIAAMGCLPIYSVITLGLKPDQFVQDIEDIYKGFTKISNSYGGEVVGGDVVKSDTFFISVTVVGQSSSGNILKRNNAKVGDLIGITGHIGCSSAGLEVLQGSNPIDRETQKHLIKAHNTPKPKLHDGQILASHGIKTAMDISDGLINDLKKICESSGVGAQIKTQDLPIDEHLKRAFPERHLEFAVSGGEDYELLFTGSEETMRSLKDQLKIEFNLIGSIHEGDPKVTVIDSEGAILDINEGGWDHFSSGKVT